VGGHGDEIFHGELRGVGVEVLIAGDNLQSERAADQAVAQAAVGRGMPEKNADPQVIPYLLYADAGAAMDWLVKTFAFTERSRDTRSDGTVNHGELQLDGGGVIMVGNPGPDFRGPGQLGAVTQLQTITITDLSAHRDRAKAAGATVSGIDIRPHGARTYSVDDPEGHRWYFTEPIS